MVTPGATPSLGKIPTPPLPLAKPAIAAPSERPFWWDVDASDPPRLSVPREVRQPSPPRAPAPPPSALKKFFTKPAVEYTMLAGVSLGLGALTYAAFAQVIGPLALFPAFVIAMTVAFRGVWHKMNGT